MAGLDEHPNWRLQTAGGIRYRRVSVSGTFTDEDASASEVYIMRAQDFEPFVVESMPAPQLFLGGLFYPPRRKCPGLLVGSTKQISVESWTPGKPIDPFLGDTGAPDGTYDDYVKVTIEYGTTPANDSDPNPADPRTFLEISADASGEFLSVPTRGDAEWVDPSGGANEKVREMQVPKTITQPEIEWNVRWKQIPFQFLDQTLIARLRSKLGKVNSDTNMTVLHSPPAETLLFVGFSLNQTFSWRAGFGGEAPVDIEFKLLEKNFVDGNVQVTHNHYYRPGVGFRKLLINGNPIYASTVMADLFAA